MCNLYGVTTAPEAIIEITRAMITNPSIGNMAPMEVYPDYAAPIVRNTLQGRELTRARWGMPKPPAALQGKRVDSGVTNVRNTASPHWRRWLGIESRCVVPFSAFSEPMRVEGKYAPGWFTLAGEQELAFFAGIWTTWTSVRKLKEGEVTADLFAFLTCAPNAEVATIHPKAMPVILRTTEEIEIWLTAPWEQAQMLQRPLPDGALMGPDGNGSPI